MKDRLRALCADHFSFFISAPALLWQVYFVLVPLALISGVSLVMWNGARWTLTVHHYVGLADIMYLKILINSVVLALITALVCLLLAFPVAFYLAVKARRWKNMMLVFLILPSWTSFIIQIYSWFFLLQKRGVFSAFFYRVGLSTEPLSFLNSYGATILGMTYCFLPFMILPLYTALERMDKKLLEASADLGASWWQTFYNIVLPLSASGIKTGVILVTIPAFGEFAIPDLMGGCKDLYLGRTIMEKFLVFRDWHSGAALVLVAFFLPLLALGLGYFSERAADVVRHKERA